jgi:hypothetical protein
MRRQTDDEETECTCPEGTDPEDCTCDDADGEMMDDAAVFTRGASFTPQSFNAEKRTVGVIWSTGAAVSRMDWDGAYVERLDLAPESVDLSELRGAPVLNSHDRFDVKNVLGVVEDPSTDGRQGVATIRFSERADVQPLVQDVAAGIVSRVSVGYKVSSWRTDKDGAGHRTKTAVRWTPVEISFTALGADAGARVRSKKPMTQATTDQREQIRNAARLFGIERPFVDQLLTRDGITIETARTEMLQHLQANAPRVDNRVTITRDEHDGFLERAANAVGHRVDSRVKLRDDARPWLGRRIADIGREFLRLEGVSTLGSDADIIRRWGSLHSTSDFSSFLSELFNKQLLSAFLIAPSGLKMLARRATVNDFRAKHVYRDSPMGKLQPVNQHGEYKRVDKSDVKPESYSIGTFAAVFGISRQALVNDDLGVFSDISAQLAIQSSEFENAQLAALLQSNPTMSDGNALFSAAHGNLAAAGTAIDDTGLGAARLALRLSTNANGQPISVDPVYLLTSATNETAAQKAIAAIYPPTVDDANVFTNGLKLVIDPRLDHLGMTKNWFVFGDVAMVPVLEYSYLSGAEGPVIETRSNFSQGADIDGTEVLCRLDFGAGAISSVGAYQNPGA